jgi:ribonuclease P protein subunit RPR2
LKVRRYKIRQLATQRIDILLKTAFQTIKSNKELAQRQAIIAWKISTKYNIRLPYEKKRFFCKKCKKFIVPGINSMIRLENKPNRCIKTTCFECGHKYRKIFNKNSQ